MEECQRQFQALSELCVSHEVKDHLLASEIRFSRKQFQEDYAILIKAFETFKIKKSIKLQDLLEGEDEDLVKTICNNELYCLYDVVEDPSTPCAIKYTRDHLEDDFHILRNALREFAEFVEVNDICMSMSPSDKVKEFAASLKRAENTRVLSGDVKDLLMASEKKFTNQKRKEIHDNLIKDYKDLQEKHAYLLKQLSISKDGDDEVLRDSKKPWRHKYPRGLSHEKNNELMASEIKFTRKHLEDEYDTLIKAFQDHQTELMSLSEQEKQKALTQQSDVESHRAILSRLDRHIEHIKRHRKHMEEKYDNFINALQQLHAKACLLDKQMFILIKRVEPKKLRRNEFERGLSKEEYDSLCVGRVNHTRKQIEEEIDTLVQAIKDFQARQTNVFGEQTVKYRKQEETQSGPKRQYRTEYEKGLSNIVKDHWLQTWNPKLERTIRLLMNARKKLEVEAAGWLEELCSKEAGDDTDLTALKNQWCYMMYEEEVDLPQNMPLQLKAVIEYLVSLRKNLKEEEAFMLWWLLRMRHTEQVKADCIEECPPNEVEDHLPQAVDVQSAPPKEMEDHLPQAVDVQSAPPNKVKDQLPQAVDVLSAVNPEAELERIIELLINASKNLQAEEASLLEELSSRQPVEEQDQPDSKKLCKNPLPVQEGEQAQDV